MYTGNMDDFTCNGSIYLFEGEVLCVVDDTYHIKLIPYEKWWGEIEEYNKLHEHDPPKPKGVPPTLKELQEDHHVRKTQFEASEEWENLKTYLKAEQEKGLKINKWACSTLFLPRIWVVE